MRTAKTRGNPLGRILDLIDDLLRGQIESVRRARSKFLVGKVLTVMFICDCLYGAVMGSFSGSLAEIRWLQVLYSAVKVPLLLAATFAISLPSFYVANSMLGLHADFGKALRAIISAQAALTIILAGLAPITFFAYVSGLGYDQALAFNAAMFGLSSLAVQVLLRRLYRPLIASDHRHRWMILAWLVIYSFVGIQMGWVFRPFIGSPDSATTFFREGAWGNAYLVVFELFTRLVSGR